MRCQQRGSVWRLTNRPMQGLAKALVAEAQALSTARGIRSLYVHVVAGNAAGLRLYEACGFGVEAEEGADDARRRQHPRRLLLGKALAGTYG
jgi:ribosomal protein S18 acetylase RimI-like enzyme